MPDNVRTLDLWIRDPLRQNSPSYGNQPAHIRLDTRVDTLANRDDSVNRKRARRRPRRLLPPAHLTQRITYSACRTTLVVFGTAVLGRRRFRPRMRCERRCRKSRRTVATR
ncbi:hypothetical protein MBOT_02840 [Mycobacterium botniense]|uniref:Uncharacterized protein n=1 Tax=Mycobacterium botniense TaxID=84962 RepID=A0A7I9XSE6_9MYCO|nr:hypothetical protein MBOT_02840 [Mycobacterium botniense]